MTTDDDVTPHAPGTLVVRSAAGDDEMYPDGLRVIWTLDPEELAERGIRDTLPPLVATALARLPAALKAAGKAVPRETLRAADQLAAARQAAARLYHQLAGQENAGKEVAADAR